MYPFKKIEKKWQARWSKNKFSVWRTKDFDKKQKRYVLDMFPYPSGDGLHVGHVEGYTASDILTRYYRMKGFNVLHPMGWDAFGLPAENYAIKTKTHPSKIVAKNVKRFKEQLQSLGFSYDWSREINTTDPEYYRWTQWIFLQLFKKGLAYEAEVPVNWCPSCKTVLANEEVIDGKCERCSNLVEQKLLKQWLLKITAYAERLLKDLDELDWPERVKEMQRQWIGRSEGALIKFPVANVAGLEIEIYTTRPDTIFGATYLVLSPEHPVISSLKSQISNFPEVEKYIESAKRKTERQRLTEAKTKTGVELKSIKSVNPVNGKEIPIWVADYVLASYGTGAIMAVPAHDERDFEFAQKFNLPVIEVIKDGELINSSQFNGLPSEIAKERIIKSLGAEKKVNYKLRDWVFSRQRYWGEPIPIIKCEKCGNLPVPEKELPVKLPQVKNYQPTGTLESPLAAIHNWVIVKCPNCGGWAKRETNTMPQWAGSNWYYLRYLDSKNKKAFVDSKRERYWMPVDLYIGGVEHAVLHLLYARFWHKFLHDLGFVSESEPFKKLINQGLILGSDGQKMSKSRGNVVNPDEVVKEFGADALRLYEMFMGPLEDAKPWDVKGIIGTSRFLNRVYQLVYKAPSSSRGKKASKPHHLLHQTIKKVTQDIEDFKFNTAISSLMILLSAFESGEIEADKESLSIFVKLLFPMASHISQELWSKLGYRGLLDNEPWPEWDEKLLTAKTFDLIVQVNGKLRDKFNVSVDITEEEAKKMALNSAKVKPHLLGKPKKIIFVPKKLINIVI